jgi:hypothetical protein
MGTRIKTAESLSAQIDAAIGYLNNESISRISISEVCRLVGMNRANLYANYPKHLEKIRAAKLKSAETRISSGKSASELSAEIALLKKKLMATTYVCVELHLALKIMSEKLERESKKSHKNIRKSRRDTE